MGDVDGLAAMLRGRSIAVLAGAGCSTDSGIPDYRGPKTRDKARSPVQFRQFVESPDWRRRYWARAMVGWPRFRAAEPNAGHYALAQLEQRGLTTGLITQNVDRLHHAAGSRRVVELHGALARVRCLQCDGVHERDDVQTWLRAANPDFEAQATEIAPDGDAELPTSMIEGFIVVDCPRCGGVLKPDVVFFGENVPAPVVSDAFSIQESADVLLVVGSSLTVFSGYRFVRAAHKRGQAVAIVTLGPTRGDPYADLKLDAPLSEVLPALLDRIE
jgi:NAD-dependent SIR2 family protein deacetylase